MSQYCKISSIFGQTEKVSALKTQQRYPKSVTIIPLAKIPPELAVNDVGLPAHFAIMTNSREARAYMMGLIDGIELDEAAP